MAARPNILLITSDQQHFNTIGRFNGEINTPNLDRLCEEGTYYNRAYTVNPTCTPTRASMITGKYPSQHGAWTLGTKLPEKEYTIGEDFSKAGYRTALVGKAHFQPLAGTERYPSLESYPILQDLDFWRSFHGPFYGFEHVELARNHVNESHVGQHYAIWMEEKGLLNWRDYFLPGMDKDAQWVWDIPEEYHYDTWIAEKTNALLEGYAKNDENFFLWASFFDPHPAYLAPEPWASMYDPDSLSLPGMAPGEMEHASPFHKMTQETDPDTTQYAESGFWLHGVHSQLRDEASMRKDMAVYYGMTSLMDKYIGQILGKLDELGLRDNTIVVFTTDHGHYFGQHGLLAKGPFPFEDLIRIPFVTRCPGQAETGVVSGAMQSLVDLPQTFLDFCGIESPDGMSGVNQKNVWIGKEESARSWAICEHNHEYKKVNFRSYIGERYKLTLYYDIEHGDLYDLDEDPGETRNLWYDPAYGDLKSEVMFRFLQAEMEKEPKFMPRVAGA